MHFLQIRRPHCAWPYARAARNAPIAVLATGIAEMQRELSCAGGTVVIACNPLSQRWIANVRNKRNTPQPLVAAYLNSLNSPNSPIAGIMRRSGIRTMGRRRDSKFLITVFSYGLSSSSHSSACREPLLCDGGWGKLNLRARGVAGHRRFPLKLHGGGKSVR